MSTDAPSAIAEDAKRRAEIDHSLRHPVMFFFTSGAAWLAISILLGAFSSLKFYFPEILEGCEWTTNGRLFPAHLNAFIYGWGMQAAFGTMLWLMARLTRQTVKSSGLILVAGHVWNLLVSLGLLGILAGRGTGEVWMAFPTQLWPAFLAVYALIGVWAVVNFRSQNTGHVYISQWFLIAAAFWFPWIYISGNYFTFVYEGNALMNSAASYWFRSALLYLFFVPVGISAIYYLAPKVSGRPVYSYKLAMLSFWSLAIIGPWAGMQKLYGGPVPQNLPLFGAAASVLLAIPCFTVFFNIYKTLSGRDQVIANSPTLRFTYAAALGIFVLGALSIFLNMPTMGMLAKAQFAISNYGFDAAALYGFFSLSMFGAIYFIVPRVTKREWLSRRFIRWHFTLSVYGSISLAIFGALIGGILHGDAIETWQNMPWANAIKQMRVYTTAIAAAWFFILFANAFFFIHLALMWLRLGRRSAHPTLLNADHGSTSPHGEAEVLEPTKA